MICKECEKAGRTSTVRCAVLPRFCLACKKPMSDEEMARYEKELPKRTRRSRVLKKGRSKPGGRT